MRRFIRVLAVLVILSLQRPEMAFSITKGQSCKNINQILDNYICIKKGKIQSWQKIVKKPGVIMTNLKTNYYLQDLLINLEIKSNSKTLTSIKSLTPQICDVNSQQLSFNTIGVCSIELINDGDKLFQRVSSKISFTIQSRNQLELSLLGSYLLNQGNVKLPENSSANLKVIYESKNTQVCKIEDFTVTLLSHGDCIFSASQPIVQFVDILESRNYSFKVIRDNQISYNGISQILLSNRNYKLPENSSAGLSIVYKSNTQDICLFNNGFLDLIKIGKCVLNASQPGDDYTVAAKDLQIEINIIDSRAQTDQPDVYSGYQIKPVYVLPNDGFDHEYDLNGYLTQILDEGNNFLFNQIGLKYQIDRTTSGYDIQFLRSKMSKSQMLSASNLGNDLYRELNLIENPSLNRKEYVFFLDVESLRNGAACGYASMPGFLSVVALGSGLASNGGCSGSSGQFKNYVSLAWVHESFHSLGVDHNNEDSCDLMRGVASFCSIYSIDKTKTKYVGSEASGANVIGMRIWASNQQDLNSRANCQLAYSYLPSNDGTRYALCPTGSQQIGALNYCWSAISTVELQVLQNNSWQSVGSGSASNSPWGKYLRWQCTNTSNVAPTITVYVSEPGVKTYRWLVDGRVAEQFKIYWQA